MGDMTLDQIQITPLKRIHVSGGDVLHAFRRSDEGFLGFGEAYFSMIELNAVKAWKLHRRMTLNLVVPWGDVRFVFTTDRSATPREETIGFSNYARLTVPPGIWFGFQGVASPHSLILNVADIEHDPDEVQRRPQEDFEFKWGEKQ